MQGRRFEFAREAVLKLIDRLGPDDELFVFGFNQASSTSPGERETATPLRMRSRKFTQTARQRCTTRCPPAFRRFESRPTGGKP